MAYGDDNGQARISPTLEGIHPIGFRVLENWRLDRHGLLRRNGQFRIGAAAITADLDRSIEFERNELKPEITEQNLADSDRRRSVAVGVTGAGHLRVGGGIVEKPARFANHV